MSAPERTGAGPRPEGGPGVTAHLWRRREPWARALALAPLVPLAWMYAAGARLHRSAYRRGWMRAQRLPVHVVSVGNLSVGGSGKTPTAAWLARELRDRGRRVALVGRGVGGRRVSEVNVVSDGQRVLLGPDDVGDEPVWLARAVPGVPVLAGRNRAALGLRAVSAFEAEIVILDDGFQHHRVERDVDLVCIDASLLLGNGYTLPRGPLRESPRVLRHADALVLTRGQGLPRDPLDPDPLPAALPRFHLHIDATGLRPIEGGPSRALETLRGTRVGLVTAIARPDRLRADLVRRGARVEQVRAFADHHLYRRADLAHRSPELCWITTAKDAVKIPAEWVGQGSLHVLEEEVVEPGPPALADFVLRGIDASGSRRRVASR